MGNSQSGQEVDPAAPLSTVTQKDSGKVKMTAQSGGVVSAPQIYGVQVGGNLTVHTCVQAAARTDEPDVSHITEGNILRCQPELKSYLLNQTENLFEGTREDGSLTLLNKIYTELYIIEGGSGEVNDEHEVIELECTRSTSEEKKIHLNKILEPLSNEDIPPQRVLMKGIAGIGKTVAVQKFTLDWAEGTANQTIQYMFPFTFRELNLIKDKSFSLTELITYYFEEVRNLKTSDYNSSTVLFIFDGLDESKYPLDFTKNEKCRSLTKSTTVDALLTNLISGNLLHKALVWITSRPAAANKIPPEFINRVTEVRGFNDEQKEEFFQKKIKDQDMAQRIFSHLHSKPLRSLYIMCHIPVFCWISATALQDLLSGTQERELPKTLTEMYTHFLIIQTKRKLDKGYQEGEADKDVIMKLGKLAFEQLKKGNVIFSEDDVEDGEIDLKQVAVYSGVCTQMIKKEHGLHKKEFYSFVHLSVQEFFAALYVLEKFIESKENLLNQSKVKVASKDREIPIVLLHKNAVNDALASDYGQWDLFLRFLLGLSKENNQKLLQHISGFEGRDSQSIQETIQYIHNKIKRLSYTDKSINLFHCLNELGDRSLVEQVQSYHSSGDVSKISPAHWSALAFVLLVSNEDLDVFDLKAYYRSDAVLERLVPVLKVAKRALLSDCKLTDRCCRYISSVLSAKSSGLEELDLTRNKLLDSGITLLSDGLKSPTCRLQRLSLKECSITSEGCKSLASGLISRPLQELDLSGNQIQDQGVKLLSDVLKKSSWKTLRLSDCGITGFGLKLVASALSLNPSHLKNLDLSKNCFEDQAVSQLSGFLKHPDCHLESLCLFKTHLKEKCAAALAATLASTLNSGPSHLRELDLGGNDLGDAGVTEVAALLQDPNCKVETLRLVGCRFTAKGCAALASSLKSNPTHLRVLDLARNDLRDQGVENLLLFLQVCHLEKLSLKCCTLTTAACRPLTLACGYLSALKELDLSFNQLKEQDETFLHWLETTQCRLEILRL